MAQGINRNKGEAIMANQYRKQGNHLFKLNYAGDAYIHFANLPQNIKSLAAAIRWYEQ